MRRLRFVAFGLLLACGSPPNPQPSIPPPPLVVPTVAATQDAGARANVDAGSSTTDTAAFSPREKKTFATQALLAKIEADLADGGAQTVKDERAKLALIKAFTELRTLMDPRAADVLAKLVAKSPPLAPRWRSQAALALGELSDIRAVPALAWRMRQDPLVLYKQNVDDELRRDDNERVVAARYLTDIVAIYPEKKDEIAKGALDAVRFWVLDKPQPHANGLRFMGMIGDAPSRTLLRKFADPTAPLPKAGQTDFPPLWATAQSSLRYLGASQRALPKPDEAVFEIMKKQLFRRPSQDDATMESLIQNGAGVKGMTLRSLGVGASQGLAESGDPRAFDLLVRYIESELDNEQSRMDAGFALGFVATEAQLVTIASKVLQPASTPKKELIRRIFMEPLMRRATPSVAASLLPLIDPSIDPELSAMAAGAIGHAGVDATTQRALVRLLDDQDLRYYAVFALVLGADEATAKAAVLRLSGPQLEHAKVLFAQRLVTPSDRDLSEGRIARRVRNARACGGWVYDLVSRDLSGVLFDSGPYSLTRGVLRARLIADASDPKKRTDALMILEAMKQDATVDALLAAP